MPTLHCLAWSASLPTPVAELPVVWSSLPKQRKMPASQLAETGSHMRQRLTTSFRLTGGSTRRY
eukprot:5562923-Prorocentrum_lima.AAC.1